MADHTVVNLREVEDQAPRFGLSPDLESRFARVPLGLEQSGISYFRIAPGYRIPFGHRHERQEEVYLVVEGSARIRLEGEEEPVELGPWDAIRIPGPVARGVEGGPDGCQLVAFGAPNTENKDAEMLPGWWGG